MYANLAVSAFLYFMYLAGILLIQADNLRLLLRRFRLRRRLSAREIQPGLTRKCSQLLSAALGRNIDGVWLISAVLIIFILVFSQSCAIGG